MSDTPRTDSAYFSNATLYDLAGEMKKLERELTAAQAEALKLQEENAKLQERVNLLERLVDGVHYIDGVHLEEIDGLNWFDARKKAKDTQ